MCSGTSSHRKHRELTGNVHSSKADPFPRGAEVLHRVFHPSVQGCGAGTHGVYWEKARDATRERHAHTPQQEDINSAKATDSILFLERGEESRL